MYKRSVFEKTDNFIEKVFTEVQVSVLTKRALDIIRRCMVSADGEDDVDENTKVLKGKPECRSKLL